jgi:lipid A ethanolaminephosphotransferase
MPSHTGGPAFSVLLAADKLVSGPPPKRKAVGIQARHDGPRRHLIVVMDESVRGDLIDLNQPGTARTGLLPHVENLANFGVASSMANCSDTGNYSFRYAATAERYLEDVARHPSLFEYARKAGYATAYLDGQRYAGRLQNFMDEIETSQIDLFYQVPADTRLTDHDRLLAEKIADLVDDSSQPQFIYVNKMGSHFPYEGKYPADRRLFKPTMQRDYFGRRVDLPVRKLTMDESAETRLRFRNSYLNSVSWNAESFFDVLTARLNLNESIILYTADHGQDLHEDGRKGWGTHCSHGDSPPGEGRVPLLLIGGGHEFLARAKRAAAMNHDRANQFSAARSLLLLLGYDRNDVNRELGVQPDLFEDLSGYQPGFLSTYFVRFEAEPVWNSIK